MDPMFSRLTLCLDMYGCPNRCRHCWVGHSPNGHMTVEDFREIGEKFRPFAREFEIESWYREPDFHDNYRELWELREQLSTRITPHYELISTWRLVRDDRYVKWLLSLGLTRAQITLFGGEKTTDCYTGRKGAYAEILRAFDILIENEISPRIQVFVNKDNLWDLPAVEGLIREKQLQERCAAFGGEFDCFVHQGSCDGENARLYNIRVTREDLDQIPPLLTDLTLRYFSASELGQIFGQPESELYEKLGKSTSTADFVTDFPILFVDQQYRVYPNITAPATYWCLGNLKENSPEEILENYRLGRSKAQTLRKEVPFGEMVRRCGDPQSGRLFCMEDYEIYILNQYCESMA